MLSSLSVTHGFLSPHPAPTAIAEMFKADIGKTLLYGIIIPFPTIIVAGSLLSRTIKHIKATPLKEFYNPVILKDHEMPKMGVSIFTPLLPVLLIIISTLAFNFLSDDLIFKKVIVFLGNPVIAMLISVLVAIYTLELLSGKKMTEIMDSVTKSIASITMVLLIIAGGIPTFPIHSKRKNVVVSPGTPLLWDQGYTNLFPDLNFRPAAVLLSRIISKPNSNLICFDLGHKSVASEMQFPRVEFLNITNCEQIRHSEEHLVVACNDANNYTIGDISYSIPIDICPTVSKYKEVLTILNGKITGTYKVVARDHKTNV